MTPENPPAQPRACPGCGADDSQSLRRYRVARLVRCRRCELVFALELPSPEVLLAHYADYPSIGQLTPLTSRRYAEVLDRLEAARKSNRLLDVGCGDGHFLVAAKHRGWNVYGSELGEAPRQRARSLGLDVREAPFPVAEAGIDAFDAVAAIEVLEHVTSPRDEVEHIAKLLRPGGYLYLTTPNFDAISRRLLGPRWRAIDYPEHLNLFTPPTLDHLLGGVGLRRVALTTTGISLSDIWAAVRPSDRGCSSTAGGCLDACVRAGVEASPTVDRLVELANSVLTWLSAGDTIKALYVRP